MSPFLNPVLFISGFNLRLTREDLYQSIIDKLDNTTAASMERLDQIFGMWSKRDHDRNDLRAMAMKHIHRCLLNGQSFADAIRPFVPRTEALIIQSGEVKGNLGEALKLAVRNMNDSDKMRGVVMGAISQPLMGFLSILALSIILGVFMWPDILKGVPLEFWPAWSHPAIHFQLWLGERWIWLGTLVIPVWLYMYTVGRWTGSTRHVFDSITPWSIYKSQNAAIFLSVLAALVESGKTVREALLLMRDNSNPYLAWRTSQIIRRYDAGGNEGIKALRTGFFNRQIMDRVEDAATNKSFGDTLRHVGTKASHTIFKAVQAQAAAANGIFLVAVGAAFIYTTAVIVFGMQEAVDALTRSFGI
jgi:type II secretory pathway component PulF